MSKLSPHDLDRFAIGLFDSEIVDGAWRAHRIPPGGLRDHYMSIEWARMRATSPAGVRLRFRTDAQRVTARLRFGERSRERNGAALIVDQDPLAHLAGPIEWRQGVWEGVIFDQPNRRQRTFDLWLPHMCQCDIMEIEAVDADIAPIAKPALRWLVYGDSITQGMETPLPTDTAIGRCAAALDAEVLNLAIGGAQLETVLADHVPDAPFDLVSIAYGTNDFYYGMPIETHVSNTRRLIEALRRKLPRTPIVLITVINDIHPGGTNPNGLVLDDFRRALTESFAREPGITLAPGQTLVPPEPQFFIDDVHPNGSGFALYAQNLLPHLRASLQHAYGS